MEIEMDQVHSLFGNLPRGDVILKLMRPTNVAAVHRILDGIAAAKRRSREGNFTVEVFGQAAVGGAPKARMSPAPQPRPENAPAVDPEILNLFENDKESPVFQEREVRSVVCLLHLRTVHAECSLRQAAVSLVGQTRLQLV